MMPNTMTLTPPVATYAILLLHMLSVSSHAYGADPFDHQALGSASPAANVESALTLLDESSDTPGLLDEIDLSVGADFVTKYIARGIVFANEPSIQPWAELGVPLGPRPEEHETDDRLRWRIGTWNSMQFSSARGVGRSQTTLQRRFRYWYETDIYTGLIAPLGEHARMMFTYFYYTSPGNGFDDIHELELRLHYDDAHWWTDSIEGFSLNPSVRVTREVYNTAVKERWYIQPSITPSYTFEHSSIPLTVQVPVVLGFSPEGWYRDADGNDLSFGYVQTGVRGSIPIDISEDGPPLTLTAGVDILIVNDRAIHGFGKRTDVVGRVGLSYSF